MVRVQVSNKNLVEVVVGDLQGRDAFGRSGADVKDEFIAIAELDEEASRSLGGTGGRHACAAGDYPHLIRCEVLAVGRVEVTRTCLHR